MRAITRRLDALERASGGVDGWDYSKPTHSIIYGEEQTHAEGLAEYMARFPDKEIGPDDNVIWIELVSPAFDESGALIPKEPRKIGAGHGPTLGEVMEALKLQGENREAGQ